MCISLWTVSLDGCKVLREGKGVPTFVHILHQKLNRMSKKKPVPNEKTNSVKIDQIESKKPIPVNEVSDIPSDTPTLPTAENSELSNSDTMHTIDNDRPVGLAEVLQLKKSGNYEVLEYHIRRGALEMLPTADVERLLRISQEHAFLCDVARRLLAALQPLLEKEKEVSAYLDLDSKLKVDFAKIMEEAAMVMMNPKHKTGLPFWNLIQACFDAKQFKGMSLQPLQSILAHQGFAFKPYQGFAAKLGLMPVETAIPNLTPADKQA